MSEDNIVQLVYDGECPICKPSANAFKIKKAAGELRLINKRTDTHPIMDELKEKGIHLKNGMVIKMNGNIYQGADALHVAAMIGTGSDFLNKANVRLFHCKAFTKAVYPFLRAVRCCSLKCKGVSEIAD